MVIGDEISDTLALARETPASDAASTRVERDPDAGALPEGQKLHRTGGPQPGGVSGSAWLARSSG